MTRSRLHLGRPDRLRRARLRAVRRLRSRHRHPVPLPRRRPRARPGHELGGAGVGRQRDLAGARRRRADGGVSAGLRRGHAGALRADHRHAAGPHLPRRRLRVPLAHGARQVPVGLGLRRWARCVAAFAQGIALGASVQGIPVSGSRLCRRLVELADAGSACSPASRWSSAMRCSAPPG